MRNRLAKMRITLRTSPNWTRKREVGEGELVLADSADNLPGEGKYWIHPAHPGREWEQDATGPYGVLVEENDIEFVN